MFLTIAVLIYLKRDYLYDFYRGLSYQPTTEMSDIRDRLQLTDHGKFLFNASHPELNSAADFNNNCRADADESAVLGCYTVYNIYVYNIDDPRLPGIRELTVAHELLHASFARLSTSEKDHLKPLLDQAYHDNQSILKSEIDSYSQEEQFEELYVRAGTEIKTLPADLESHYAKFFKDQDKIVDFYNSYIQVFRELENELNTLKSEMENLNQQINAKTLEYETKFNDFEPKVAEFNNCARTAGCFNSNSVFNTRRRELLSEQSALERLYSDIDNLIDEYNSRVEKYNNNIIESENLQNIINSRSKPESI